MLGANKKTLRDVEASLKVAGSQGFEPRLTVPKTEVLPLHHEPNESRESRNQDTLVK